LEKLFARPGMGEIFISCVKASYNSINKHINNERRQTLFQLDEINARLKNAREMYADQKMDVDDYKAPQSKLHSYHKSIRNKTYKRTTKGKQCGWVAGFSSSTFVLPGCFIRRIRYQ
jgi:hypothetical protein